MREEENKESDKIKVVKASNLWQLPYCRGDCLNCADRSLREKGKICPESSCGG